METALVVSQVISTFVLTLTLVVVGIYTWKTWDMANATRQSAEAAQRTVNEMRESRDEESRPYVICGFELEHNYLVYFYVKNIGKTVATDVKVAVDPSLTASRGQFTDIAFLTDGIASLAPNQEIRTLFDSLIGLYGDKADVPLLYSAIVTYFGGMDSSQRSSKQTLDLNVYRGTSYTTQKDMDALVREVEEIAGHLSDIKGTLKEISGTVERGVWIRNPDLLVTTRSVTDDSIRASNALAAKLQEFKLMWEAAPREDSGRVQGLVYHTTRDVQARSRQLGQQILAILAWMHPIVSDEALSDATAISAHLLQLARMSPYREIQDFNNLGSQIVTAVGELLQKLSEEKAEAQPVPLEVEPSDASVQIAKVQVNGDENTSGSEPTAHRENRRRRPPSRTG